MYTRVERYSDPICIQCLQKKGVKLKSIQFGKEWHEMHRSLGIN